MEILFFILGIASVVVIATAIVAVVSIVKIVKTQKELSFFYREHSSSIDITHRRLDEELANINRKIDELDRVFNSQLDSRLDKIASRTDRSLDDLHKKVKELSLERK